MVPSRSRPHPPPSWVWPQWLERQLDPASPAFVTAGDDPWTNRRQRNWTVLGSIGGPGRVSVDRCGLIHPHGRRWSLDWWVGAEDRWHLPSREVAVRQRLVDDAPVVETALRVPGGDALSRVYAVAGDDGGDTFIVEVEAACAVPFAVAWALRPVDLCGVGRIGHVALDGETVEVDGEAVLWLPTHPGRMALATAAEGDAAEVVLGGRATPAAPASVRCPEGMATAAFVFPVSHRTTLTARLVVAAGSRPSRGRRRAPGPGPFPPAPAVDRVARAWQAQVGRSLRLELPAGPLASALAAQRRHLLLLAAGIGEPGPTAARVAVAAGQAGFTAEATTAVESWLAPGVRWPPGPPGAVAGGCALWAAGELVAIGALDVPRSWLVTLADRAERLGRSADRSAWRAVGLRAATSLLAAGGEAAAATAVQGWLAGDTGPASIPPPAAAPTGIDAGTESALAATGPLRSLSPDAGAAVAARARAHQALVDGMVAVGVPVRGLSPSATLALAVAVDRAGETGAGALVDRVLRAATPTWTWPDLVHPAGGGGTAGEGHSALVTAELWTVVRGLLVDDTTPDRLALWPRWPRAWTGAQVEVHGLATRAGTLSFALRWHGERPALLWELTGTAGPVAVTAPGIDPGWSSTDPAGEALLHAVPDDGATIR